MSFNIPLVDIDETNGSPAVIPCTHYLPPPPGGRFDAALVEEVGMPVRRIDIPRGTIWSHDPRVLHRGTPNRSSEPRPRVTLAHHLPGFDHRQAIELTRRDFDRLSARGRQLLRNAQIVDAVQPVALP